MKSIIANDVGLSDTQFEEIDKNIQKLKRQLSDIIDNLTSRKKVLRN